MGKNLKLSLVKLGSSEELGDHPAALMMAEVFVPESYGDLIFCLLFYRRTERSEFMNAIQL